MRLNDSQRPLCEHCAARPAKPDRRFCNTCYRQGFRKADWVLRRESGFCTSIDRPAALADTGMLINDDQNVLIHPDGTLEQPVPRDLVHRFFFEPIDGYANLLRVLRVASNTNHEGEPCLA